MPLEPLTPEESARLQAAKRPGGRPRVQQGYVEEVGKKPKRWIGHYYLYEFDKADIEHRRHRRTELGLRSEMGRTEAKKALRAFLDTLPGEARQPEQVKPSPAQTDPGSQTLLAFTEQVFFPMYEPTWKESARKDLKGAIRRYVLKAFGSKSLNAIAKAELQIYINGLAERYSEGVVDKALTWSRAILEEAVDQERIAKNPARKLKKPECRAVRRPVVQIDELRDGFARLPLRERIIIRLGIVLGLRPGEILALRVNDINGHSLRIDEGTRHGRIYTPKTEESCGHVWMTPEILAELKTWIALEGLSGDMLLFRSPTGKTARLDNYRKRFFKPIMKEVGLGHVTMQMCRRSCATFMSDGKHGTLKDVQTHLRHSQSSTTADIYIQAVPLSVRKAVESLDAALFAGMSLEGAKGPAC